MASELYSSLIKASALFGREPDIVGEHNNLPRVAQDHDAVHDFGHPPVVQAGDRIVENDRGRGFQRSFGEKVGERDDFLLSLRQHLTPFGISSL